MKLNKKALSFAIWNFIRVFLIGLLIPVFAYSASNYILSFGNIPEGLDELVYVQRFVYSSECFALYDNAAERVYPLEIDLSKFNNEKFKTCYAITGKGKAFRLTLKYDDKEKVIESVNWNGLPTRTFSKKVYVNSQPSKLFVEVNNG